MRFRTILADPPWQNRTANPRQAAFSAEHYRGLTIPEMCALQVADIAEDDAYLFLWSDAQHHHVAPEVARAWGFPNYATKFTWLKTDPNTSNDCPGIGRYSMVWSEDCWLFKRGRPALVESSLRNPFRAPRRAHSRKPDELYEFIEGWHFKKKDLWRYPEPRLELFARTHLNGKKMWDTRPGWVQVGDEFDGDVGLGENICDSLKRLSDHEVRDKQQQVALSKLFAMIQFRHGRKSYL